MFAIRNTSIKQHLTLMIMFISSISVLLTTFTISYIGYNNLKQSIIDELVSSASIIGDRNKAILAFGESIDAEENLQNVFSVRKEIMLSCIYKNTGDLFAYYPKEYGKLSNCPTKVIQTQIIGNESAYVMQPIVSQGSIDGHIYIKSNLVEVTKYVRKQSAIAFVVTVTVLVISYVLALRLQQFISNPILSLTQTARAISHNKDYSIRANPFGDRKIGENNELGTLTDAFNAMLTEIGARDKRLKQQYVELEKAKDAAEASNRAKSQFLANISHELRTPLNAIIGFSSILVNQLFGPMGDAKYLEYSKDINDSGNHLLEIINDILDLSKAEAGKLSLNYEEVHVPKAILKCINIISDRAERGKVKITYDAPRTLPPLFADRLRFIQILLNILSNAVKFTPEGGNVHVAVTTALEGNDVAQFKIAVSDTGIGMSEQDIQKAFQSFGQVDSGLNRKYEGAGLGIPLTKKLIEIHHGSLEIESEPKKGTTVYMTFPAVPPEGVILGVASISN